MGLWSLFLVASAPIMQVLLIGMLGAFFASGYSNLLHATARRDMNKIVFSIFTPSLIFASLSKTVTFEEIISWWFMPVNLGIVFLFGGILGWIVVKLLKPPEHLEGLVVATCSSGNLGNLMLIIIPAACLEKGNPFDDETMCSARALSYVSFSMALGGFYIWTYTYSLIRKDGKVYHRNQSESHGFASNGANLMKEGHQGVSANQNTLPVSVKSVEEVAENKLEIPLLLSGGLHDKRMNLRNKLKEALHNFVEELLAPPTVASIIGLIVGAVPWLKSLFIGSTAPLKVVQDSIRLLGDGTVPCITLILGGNLAQGIHKSTIKPMVIFAIVCVRYMILPLIGIAVAQAAYEVGFTTYDPLYRYVLMIQFTLPPAMNIATMNQLFDVGQEESSVIFLWTYLIAAIALTFWSAVFMWILS